MSSSLKQVLKKIQPDPNLISKFLITLMELFPKNPKEEQLPTRIESLLVNSPWQFCILYENEGVLSDLKRTPLFNNSYWKILQNINLLPNVKKEKGGAGIITPGELYNTNNCHRLFKLADKPDKKYYKSLTQIIKNREYKVFQNETFCRLEFKGHLGCLIKVGKNLGLTRAKGVMNSLENFNFFCLKEEKELMGTLFTQKSEDTSFFDYSYVLDVISSKLDISTGFLQNMDCVLVMEGSVDNSLSLSRISEEQKRNIYINSINNLKRDHVHPGRSSQLLQFIKFQNIKIR